jgi:hypothetical protein
MSGGADAAQVRAMMLRAGFTNLLVDRVTAEVVAALDEAGVPTVVLKGPAISSWLYDAQEVRAYGDSDLLVRREDWDRAAGVLSRLGFDRDVKSLIRPTMDAFSSDPWEREGDNVDLHSTVYGLSADFATVWRVLASETETLQVGGRPVQVLGVPARTMHVALHAAQHQDGKPLHDLVRALERVPEGVWAEAASVARATGGLAAFAAGLRRTPQGEELARKLGVHAVRAAPTELRAARVPLSESMNQLLEIPGILGKLRFAFWETFPQPAFMRWWSPLARRGTAGLILAYLWRPVYLVINAPAAVRAVRRARREAGTRA